MIALILLAGLLSAFAAVPHRQATAQPEALPSLAAYYQCHARPAAVNRSLWLFRKHYPRSAVLGQCRKCGSNHTPFRNPPIHPPWGAACGACGLPLHAASGTGTLIDGNHMNK